MPKPLLRNLSVKDLDQLVATLGQPPYRARQLGRWLFRAHVQEWRAMSNLPQNLLAELAERFDLASLHRQTVQVSHDGTRKFLFRLRDGEAIESVMIPMSTYTTFCISSQVGCAMACRFCATARGGLRRPLETAEILEQVLHLRSELATHPFAEHGERQFNIVFMGMGEPLDNWAQLAPAILTLTAPAGFGLSVRRVTVSTSGHPDGLQAMLRFGPKIGLTLSVCGASADLRRRLMPVASRTPLVDLLDLVTQYSRLIGRRVTVAYILIENLTDSVDEARELASLVAGRPVKVNLIPLNPLRDQKLRPSRPEQVLRFQEVLQRSGVRATIRASGGQDIDAACGQLRQRRAAGQDRGGSSARGARTR